MPRIQFTNGTRQVRGPRAGDKFDTIITPFLIPGTSGASSGFTDKDASGTSALFTGTKTSASIEVDASLNATYSFVSELPGLSMSADGILDVSLDVNGTAVLQATVDGQTYGGEASISSTSQTIRQATSLTVGSLAAHMEGKVASIMDPAAWNATTRAIWSSNNYNPASPVAVRNASNPLVAAGVNLTAFSAMTQNGSAFPVSLISPRHVVSASHTGFARVGARVVFVGSNGVLYSANVVRSQAVSSVSDATVSYLDAAINAAVTPVSILPAFSTKLPYVAGNFRRFTNYQPTLRAFVRLVQRGLGERTAWMGLRSFLSGTFFDNQYATVGAASAFGQGEAAPPDGAVNQGDNWVPTSWLDYVAGGDSGGQVFTQVNSTTVLLSQFWTRFVGGLMSGNKTALDAAMNATKDGGDLTVYAMNEVSLAGFTTF